MHPQNNRSEKYEAYRIVYFELPARASIRPRSEIRYINLFVVGATQRPGC